MLKRALMLFLFCIFSTILVAGDVASFIDEGFSSDGKLYVFGQYGTLDTTSQGYAEIYTVDIAKNDYVDGAVFTTPASAKTSGKKGHNLYTDLRKNNSHYLDGLKLESGDIDSVLYLRGSSSSPNETITVKDFEESAMGSSQVFTINLTPWFSGNTSSSQSSFFISVEKHNDSGAVIGKQVIGNPDIKRKGVVGYAIEKIIKSPDSESFIFIIEKTLATSSGKSIRYMVETLEVSSFN